MPREIPKIKIPIIIPSLFFEIMLWKKIMPNEITKSKNVIGKLTKIKERQSTPKMKPKAIEKNILSFI